MVYDHSKVQDVATVDALQDPRRRVFEFSRDNVKITVAGVHLKSGDHKNDSAARLRDLGEVLKYNAQGDRRFYICGNFNEHLQAESLIIKCLKDNGLQIGESLQEMLDSVSTVAKQRSALQYQVAKMNKEDKSTKDAVFGSVALDLAHYKVETNPSSEHKRILTRI